MNKNTKYEMIIHDYKNGMKVIDIAKKYKYKNSTAIFKVLKKMGVETKTNKWTPEMINFLLKNYQTEEWDFLIRNLTPFTKEQIQHKAYEIGIKRKNYYYNAEEIRIIVDNYNLMSVKELSMLLPLRSEDSIMVKANKIGLVSREKWSVEEIENLISLYNNSTNDELLTFFKNRSISSIQSMAGKLNLKKEYSKKEYKKEDLILGLQNLYIKLGRTPFYFDIHEGNNVASIMTYNRYFGGYRNACIESGLELNSSIFGDKSINTYTSSRGDICLSKAELVITEMFIEMNINYKKEVPYRDIIKDDDRCGFKRCDWLINNTVVVEYFGLPNNEKYKESMEIKKSICKEHGIILIELYEKDLKDLKNLSQALSVTTER